MSDSASDTVWPAATLIVFREREGSAPEVLMVERAKAMAFAGGALVFPGGRVDAGDEAAAAALQAHDLHETAARIAAIRETIEEAGLPIGVRAMTDVETARARLYAGERFADVIAPEALDLDALVPFARWLPRTVSHRIFDTRFYLARLPEHAMAPVVDGNENVRLFWAAPAEVLDSARAGQVRLIFPTRRNLERLATFGSFAEAVASARAHPVRTITPWIEMRDGTEQLCIPDDLGYPVTSEPLATASRA